MPDDTTKTTTETKSKTVEKPKEDENTVARKINAWGFIILLGLVFFVFGPIAAFLSWRSNTLEGTNTALKVIFAILAYVANFFYIIWFAIMKTIIPKASTDDANHFSISESSFSPFSASPKQQAIPPATQAPPTQSIFGSPAPAAKALDADDNMMFAPAPAAAAAQAPVPLANQQGGKKKAKLRRRK